MNKIDSNTAPQLPTANTFMTSHARNALYLTISLFLVILAALWAGIANPTSAATPYQTKGSGVETKGDPQLPACGPNWEVVSSPSFETVSHFQLESVDAISTDDVWAVGYVYGSETQV